MMKKGKLIVIAISIFAIAAVGVGLTVAAQSGQTPQITNTQMSEGRHLEIQLSENVGVKENPGSP